MIFSENRYPLFGIMLQRGLGAARLVSTPSRFRAWLGIAIAGSPEFGQFCVRGFPRRTQMFKSVASAIPPRPRGGLSYTGGRRPSQGNRASIRPGVGEKRLDGPGSDNI
jgi:hypothetical protein